MSVHNSRHGDDYIEDPYPITLIRTENYQVWSCAMLLALEGKNKTSFIDGTCKRAKHDWEKLKETYDKVDGSIMFGLNHQIHTLKQNGSSIADYYHKLSALWKEFDAMIELPKCVCNASEGFKKHNQLMKLMQFLMGLDDSYMQIRSSILSREVLPDVRSAYATISSEESHRVATGSIAGSSKRNQASAFVSSMPNKNNFQRNNQNVSNGPSRPNNLNNINCGFNGHTIDRCFKIIGYPADFGKKKSGQNVKGKNISNNNSVGSSSSSGFTDEQMATLISLIKDNKIGTNVQANMTGANQHMTYTDKELDNVLDISHLKIKDLNMRNVMEIGDQCEGLYYYNDQEPVLNVLKESLQIDNKDKNVCCETFQRAKQTREPFPLSDHTSKFLGDLVHLDLWGPYKVTSSEGDSSSSSVSGSDVNTADFPVVNHGNDAYSSDDIVATQNEDVATLEESIFLSEPKSYFEASKFSHWTDAMNQEMNALLRNGTWEIVELAKDRKAIGSKWIYKIKYRSSGEIDRYKARLVAQGFGQKEGIYYEETFSHVVKMVTVRCLLNVSISNDWPVFQLDVNNAFLYGDLVETVYVRAPEGYFPSRNKVCRLKKSLYELKQTPRQWNTKLTSTLIENGFNQSKSDYSLYNKTDKGVFLALLVYVDDIIITGNNVSEIEKFKVFLKSKFIIKELGKLKCICLNQKKHVLDLLSDYGMLACKSAKTPLMSKLVISNEASVNDTILDNIIDYQKLMGKLIYLTNTRPDIYYAVHCLSQFMHSPLKSYLKIAFKILRYLKSCPGLGIHIIKNPGISLNAYSDADWAKCIVTRRSGT
ncbi:ribonuclease H-like domain-containing protein [Tanacetum coccineum]